MFGTGASVVSGLVLLRLLPRMLPGNEWGVVNVALTLLTYLPLLDGGFRLVVNREMLQSNDAGERERLAGFGQALTTRLLLVSVLLGPMLTMLYSLAPAAREAGLPASFYLATGVVGALTFGAGIQIQALVGLDRQVWMSVIQGGGSVANLGMMMIGARLGWGVWVFPAAQCVVAVVQWMAAALLMRFQLPGVRLFDLAWDSWRSEFWGRNRAGAWSVFRMQVFIVLLLSMDLLLAGWIVREATELKLYGLVSRVLGIGRSCLTSLGEALWPRIARGDGRQDPLTGRVLALNAWLFGIAGGVLTGAMPQILGWYVAKDWVAGPWLNGLLVARFLVIGMSSPATYHLLGAGAYGALMRAVGMEVLVGVVLGALGGWIWGGAGVAGGFLVSTVVGTFYPLFGKFARSQGVDRGAVGWFCRVWLRALMAVGVGYVAARWVQGIGLHGPMTLLGAAAAAGAGLLVVLAWVGGRSLRKTGSWKVRVWESL
jgi:O-antigen/teichoic acid export membrane protein